MIKKIIFFLLGLLIIFGSTIVNASIFGYNDDNGSSSVSIENNIVGSFALCPYNGVAKNIRVALKNDEAVDYIDEVKCAIYMVGMNYDLRGVTEERTITVPNDGLYRWYQFNFTSDVNVYSGSYYVLCIWGTYNASANCVVVMNYTGSVYDGYMEKLAGYGSYPDPLFPDSVINYYSIGIYCQYLQPGEENITISNVSPVNNSVQQELTPTCSVTISHIDGLPMTLKWYENTTGDWVLRQGGLNWYNTTFGYRKLITINHSQVSGDLINFPILFNVTDESLALNAQNDGDDIMFIDYEDNSTKYNHEIEYFDGATGKLLSWINITSLNNSVDKQVWLYYGNPSCGSQENITGTWDSNYYAVFHFAYDGDYNDSTGRYVYSDITNTGVTFVDSQSYSGWCPYYNSVDDKFNINSFDDLGSTLTGELWIKQLTCPNSYTYIFTEGDNYNANDWNFYTRDSTNNWRACISSTTVSDGGTLFSKNVWHYIVATWNDTSNYFKIFNDKNSCYSYTTATSKTDTYSNMYMIGNVGTGGTARGMTGYIDEVRFSNIDRSTDWINTSYNTMKNPNSFVSVGEEELNVYYDGTYTWVFEQADDYNTTYWWKVIVNDTYHNYSEIFNFRTKIYLLDAFVDDDFNASTSGWGITAFQNIQDALDEIQPNGNIYVWNGTYNATIPIYIEKPVNIIGNGSDECTLYGNTEFQVNGNGINLKAEYTNFSGFTIKDSLLVGVSIEPTGSYCSIFDCVLDNNFEGFYICGDYNNIYNNTITNNLDASMIIYTTAYGNSIHTNYFLNSLYGFNLHHPNNPYNLVYDNYFANNTQNIRMDVAWAVCNIVFNISETPGTNIIGGSCLGGNYYDDNNNAMNGTCFTYPFVVGAVAGYTPGVYVYDYLPLGYPDEAKNIVVMPNKTNEYIWFTLSLTSLLGIVIIIRRKKKNV